MTKVIYNLGNTDRKYIDNDVKTAASSLDLVKQAITEVSLKTKSDLPPRLAKLLKKKTTFSPEETQILWDFYKETCF